MITVLFFASIRDAIGTERCKLDYSSDIKTVMDVVQHCRKALPELDQLMSTQTKLMYALNQEIVRSDAAVNDNDEVALLPPVTGG